MPTFWQKFLNRLDRIDQERIERYIKNLSDEKDFYLSVFQSISDGVVALDREGRIDFVNDAARELLGLSPAQLVNKPLRKYVSDARFSRLLDESLPSLESSASMELEISRPRKRTLDVFLVPRKIDESTAGVVIILRDITAEKHREAESRQAEKLDALMTLAAGVAHEVGNPLNSLGIHMQLMSGEVEDIPKAKREKLENLVRVSQDEVKRLDMIIRQFLSVLRPTKLNLEETNLNQLLENVIGFMYYEISEQKIAIVKKFDERVPMTLVDESQLRQAFFNIIKNAIQAMPDGGTLSVKTDLKGSDIEIVFTDDGVGISGEKLGKVFDPYYTTKKSGSGLGLMIVYKIVKDHNGKIEIDSEPGEGAKVKITLPVFERKVGLLSDKRKSEDVRLFTPTES
jgi:PAS domain S-box-containing protein